MNVRPFLRFGFASFTLLLVASAHAATFQGLGGLDPANSSSSARAVSADGTTVVGTSDDVPFVWRTNTGIVPFQVPDDIENVSPRATSEDGSVVVGSWGEPAGGRPSVGIGFPPPPVAGYFRWNDFDGFDVTDTGAFTSVSAASDDGSIIVGTLNYVGGWFPLSLPFRGTPDNATSALTTFGIAGPTVISGTASGISGDGSTVVGQRWMYGAYNLPSGYLRQAFSWTEDGGAVTLPSLIGDPGSASANAISKDGSVVVGSSESEFGTQAVLWNSSGAVESLIDDVAGITSSSADAVSGDGSRIIGRYTLGDTTTPFLWDELRGFRDLTEALAMEFGLAHELTGWQLTEATGISADGMTIVGNGINPAGRHEAWIAVSMPTVTLPGDFDGNGAVENSDLTLLLNHWAESVPPTPDGWSGAPPLGQAVDNDELTSLLNRWGQLANGRSGSVANSRISTTAPEPSALASVGVGLLGAWSCASRVTRNQQFSARHARSIRASGSEHAPSSWGRSRTELSNP